MYAMEQEIDTLFPELDQIIEFKDSNNNDSKLSNVVPITTRKSHHEKLTSIWDPKKNKKTRKDSEYFATHSYDSKARKRVKGRLYQKFKGKFLCMLFKNEKQCRRSIKHHQFKEHVRIEHPQDFAIHYNIPCTVCGNQFFCQQQDLVGHQKNNKKCKELSETFNLYI